MRLAAFGLLLVLTLAEAKHRVQRSEYVPIDEISPPVESIENDENNSDSFESDSRETNRAQKDDSFESNSQSMESDELHHHVIKHLFRPKFDQTRKYLRGPCLKKSGKLFEHKTYPRTFEHPGFEASVPRTWDWRNVSGVNYCSPNRNQHIPVYCGSCWVFGSLGALNDRFNVARNNRWPMTMLSPQEIIDCNGKGSCQGGEVGNVYEHAKVHGLVEEGCNNYKAVNGKCDPFHRCGTCWPESCDPVQNYTKYYVKDYGTLSGRLNMMSEIHNRGPIACAIGATSKFEFNYTSGIYSEFSDLASNHIVSVSGWGFDEDSKLEYWIVRNSWGDAFGEQGWFRVVTSIYQNGRGDLYNMGIERECYYVDPDVSNLN